jgi:hypothetical protein
MRQTLAAHDRASCLSAINAAIELYRDLRKELNPGKGEVPSCVELEAVKYLKEIEQKVTKR